MKNKMDDLRNHLFSTLEALRDNETPMEIDRARAIAQVAQTLIDSAKVEVEVMKLTGATGSGFISVDSSHKGLPNPDDQQDGRRTIHRIRG